MYYKIWQKQSALSRIIYFLNMLRLDISRSCLTYIQSQNITCKIKLCSFVALMYYGIMGHFRRATFYVSAG